MEERFTAGYDARRYASPKTHGLSKTPLYRVWQNIKERCNNPNSPNYQYYGGRGISICDRWLSFENFYKDMGPRPDGTTIDRINNDGNYEPGNCRWVPMIIQRHNRRLTS